MRKRIMDDRPSSLPLTIKSRPGSVRDISHATAPQRKFSYHVAQKSAISQSRFSLPTLAGSPGENLKTQEIKNETAIKHMDHADSWFSFVRANHPGRTALAIQAESELIPAYPWSGTTPTSESLHLPDQVSFDSTLGALQFFQQIGRAHV